MYPALSPLDLNLPDKFVETDQTDLTNCEREAIHIPGSIQPNGILLFLSNDLSSINAFSENIIDLLGYKDLLGKNIISLIDKDSIFLFEFEIKQSSKGIASPFLLHLRDIKNKLHFGMATIHHNGQGYVIEWQEVKQDAKQLPSPDPIYYSDRLKRSNSYKEIIEEIAKIIKEATEFDRVMVYRFDKDWNGQVVSECKEQYLNSFLDLHYPATDIPSQARLLYLKNTVRYISDIHYKSIPIVMSSQLKDPLDLSLARFRSVSPVHLHYLENMNVAATLTISIIIDGQLWGLVACHHYSPRYLPLSGLRICEWFSEIFSLNLKNALDKQKLDYSLALAKNHDSIISKIADQGLNWKKVMQLSEGPDSLLYCDGSAVIYENQIYCSRLTLPETLIQEFASWLAKNHSHIKYFATDSVTNIEFFTEKKSHEIVGILAVPFDDELSNWTFWFRKEYLQTIRWAGDPTSKVLSKTQDGMMALSPRNSFEEYKQVLKNKAFPWLSEEIEAAVQYAKSINSLILNQLAKIESLKDEIETLKLNEIKTKKELIEKEVLIKEIHHRVKNNLQVINSILYLQSTYTNNRETILTLEESQNRILSMAIVHEMLYQAENYSKISVEKYFGQLIGSILETYKFKNKPSRLKTQIESIYLDLETGIPVGLILNELLTNALKYSVLEHSESEIYIKLAKRDESNFILEVKDSGLGLPNSYDWKTPKSLGLTLVQSLVKQIRGSIDFINKNGLCVTVIAPFNKK